MKANAKLNIIHIDTALEWRGGQQQLLYLAEGMFRRGHPIKVACPKDAPLSQRLEALGVPTIDIPVGWSLKTIWTLRQHETDCFAAHTSHAHGICTLLSRPFVVHRRVDFIPSSPWKYRQASAYICVSKAVQEVIQKVCPNVPNVCVYDGVPETLSKTRHSRTKKMSVLSVGACVPHKGHDILSKAAEMLSDVDFWVAGEGPCKYPNLHYLGHQDNIAELMCAAHLIVHPSREEGLGQSVIEAMMLGCELIVSDAGGLPELVGDTARIVPKENPKALAEAIREGLKTPSLLNRAAQERAMNYFSCAAMVDETIKVYESVVQYSRSKA